MKSAVYEDEDSGRFTLPLKIEDHEDSQREAFFKLYRSDGISILDQEAGGDTIKRRYKDKSPGQKVKVTTLLGTLGEARTLKQPNQSRNQENQTLF